jgi:hypothetical protein
VSSSRRGDDQQTSKEHCYRSSQQFCRDVAEILTRHKKLFCAKRITPLPRALRYRIANKRIN